MAEIVWIRLRGVKMSRQRTAIAATITLPKRSAGL